GVGKTSLAIEYAHRFRDLYAGVWWCPGETRAGLLASLAAFAVALGAAAADEGNIEKAAKAAMHRLAEQRANWLLIYDNVTSPDDIADLLPARGASILITSRFSDWGGWAPEVSLDVMPIEPAIALLQSRAGRSDEAGALLLAEALGRLTLALDHAAATCRRTQMSFADFSAKATQLIDTAPRGAVYPRSIAATFDLAIAEAVRLVPAAEPLMAYLAQCAPQNIPMTLLEGAVDSEGDRLNALAALAEVSLVRHDPFEDGTAAVTVHRLVQAVAHARSNSKGTTQETTRRLLKKLLALYPASSFRLLQSWPLCERLTPHVLALRDGLAQTELASPDWPELQKRAGIYFWDRGAFVQATDLLRASLGGFERTLGPDDPATADCANSLGVILQERGDYSGARALYER